MSFSCSSARIVLSNAIVKLKSLNQTTSNDGRKSEIGQRYNKQAKIPRIKSKLL